MRKNRVVREFLLLREWVRGHCCACMLLRVMRDANFREEGLAGLAKDVLASKEFPACNGARALAQRILREQK